MQGFTNLLKQTWQFSIQNKVPFIIGALVFGIAMMFSQGMYESRIKSSIDSVMQESDTFNERMEELSRRIEMGDEAALQEMVGEYGPGADLAIGVFAKLLPTVLVFLFLIFIIYTFAYTYFLALAVQKTQGIGALAGVTLKKFLPMIGLTIWTLLRSFIWIPVAGFFIAIYFIPRLLFGGVIYMKEGKGVLESVSLSYTRTKGNWIPIFGYVVGIVVVSLIVFIVFSFLAAFTGPASGLLTGVFGELVFGFTVVFVVLLAGKMLGQGRPQPQAVGAAAQAPMPSTPPPAPTVQAPPPPPYGNPPV